MKGDLFVDDRRPDLDRRPVEGVSWFEAQEFCCRLSQRTGRTYTLPSESQWEYACRALVCGCWFAAIGNWLFRDGA